jgi:lambda family phage tail tape measure protein
MMEKTGLQNEEELTKQYPQQVAAINAAADARQNRMIPALEQEIALSQQWSTGWNNAFATFQDSAHNNATAAASVFNTMTSSMQSTLLNFFNTGKMGWKSFASAILVECERIMVAKMAAGLLSSTTSFFTGGGTASTAGGISASSSGYSFQGFGTSTDFKLANRWCARVAQFYANGDVFNSPTMFSHSGGLGS